MSTTYDLPRYQAVKPSPDHGWVIQCDDGRDVLALPPETHPLVARAIAATIQAETEKWSS